MKDIFVKYRGLLLYLVFGALTTFVNVLSYWLCAHLMHLPIMVSTVIAWVFAVLFAYLTNRKWVFESQASDIRAIVKEMTAFFSCRIATGLLDWAIMFIFVDKLSFNDLIVKIIANFIVIVLNFIASKLIIFKGGLK